MAMPAVRKAVYTSKWHRTVVFGFLSMLDSLHPCLDANWGVVSSLLMVESFQIWTFVPARSKETASMANFMRWMPRPCSELRFSTARGYRNIIGVESMSLVSDDDEHSLGAFAAATDANE